MMEEIDETEFAEDNDGSLLQDECSLKGNSSGVEHTAGNVLDLEDKEKHISIQKSLSELESLVDQSDGKKKPCPLCPEDRFRPCHTKKLQDHLLNVHWKVSVEFEGYRMCVCFLPCSPIITQNEDQLSAKANFHYHCIICSTTVVGRKRRMIKHVKHHVSKVNSSTARPQGILHDSGDVLQVPLNSSITQKSGTVFIPKITNRERLLCSALAVLTEERKPLKCLDAFSSTGMVGLQWKKYLGNSVKVTLNDIRDSATTAILENCHLNQMKVIMRGGEEISAYDKGFGNTVEVTQMDANVLMHTRSFDFIHLDPSGTSVNYLDAAFRNIKNLGVLSVTSTDTGTLYAKAVHVAKRHYDCNIIKTEYYRELAARMVLAAVARAAARYDKGIDVLLCMALEYFVLVIVRVLSCPMLADESMKMISNVVHCQSCQERVFQKEGNMLEENPYQQLPCDCHNSMPGRSAVLLGPVWSGSLFSSDFLKRMLSETTSRGAGEIQPLLKTLIFESECTTAKQFTVQPSQCSQEDGVFIKIPQTDVLPKSGKRKRHNMKTQVAKRLKTEHPPFYYSINQHGLDKLNLKKWNTILQYMSEAGFQASRTNFDSTGIRTNASLATFKAILQKNISPSGTSQASSCKKTPEALQEEPQPAETSSDSDEN